MEERRQIVNRYVQEGLPTKVALSIADLPRSTYYYKPNGLKGGKRPSTHTFQLDGFCVTNGELVTLMEHILEDPFIDYGVKRMTMELCNNGFVINKKKTYRLMKERHLLFPKIHKHNPDRQFVKYSVPDPSVPFETIEIDIKYIHIQGQSRNSYLITAIDTFTRIALEWSLDFHMKVDQVALLVENLIRHLNQLHTPEKFFIRTDNGPQFVAKKLKECLRELPFEHEFILPGTPQQNAHIESFHSIVSKLVTTKFEFENIAHARDVLVQFYTVYNDRRIMTVLGGKSPRGFYKAWCEGKIEKKKKTKGYVFISREKPDICHGSPLRDLFGQTKIIVSNEYIS